MSITSATTTAAATTTSSGSSKLIKDVDTFLKLLTTQLQNQDPTEPTDTNQMTDQLSQYSQIEQQINSNDKLDSILAALNGNNTNQNLSYIGRVVEFDSSRMSLVSSDTNNRSATISYTLPNIAKKATIEITDAKTGKVVQTLPVDTGLGRHVVTWDGKKADGTVAADGTYDFKIKATDKDDTEIKNIKTSFIGYVYSLKTTNDGAQLDLGNDFKVKPSSVNTVYAI